MKKKSVEEKLSDLVQAFHEKKELSVNEIIAVLSCNRQSVYNYIDRLRERGFTIECETKQRTAFYSLSQNEDFTSSEHYIPLTKNILRKYSIMQQLHKASIKRQRFSSVSYSMQKS